MALWILAVVGVWGILKVTQTQASIQQDIEKLRKLPDFKIRL